MNLKLIRTFFFLSALLLCTHSLNATSLIDHFPKNDKRYPTFKMATDLLEKRGAKVLVETGTGRNGIRNRAGDGASTVVFGSWAYHNGAHFFSVDIDPRAVSAARRVTRRLSSRVHVILSDSIAYLQTFNQPIDFLYLDSYDFDFDNPRPSQEHHLKEIQAAYNKLSPKCFILIDDCDLPHGGKGALVIPYLQDRDWRILAQGYQVLLVR